MKKNIVGEGTYGVVYRAVDKTTDREVAIKKLRLLREQEGISFTALREIKILQELRHPNIMEVGWLLIIRTNECSLSMFLSRIRM